MKTWLCIDAGTTHLKLALKDEDGLAVGMWSTRLESLVSEGGYSEMDMNVLWREVRRGVEALGAEEASAAALANLAGIGVCAQGDGLWLTDESGEPVRRAILWNDTRAKEIMARFEEKLELLCAEKCSVAQFSGSNAVLMRWLAENEPESLKRAAHTLHCKDWLNYRMTGRVATDSTDAGTSLLSRKTGEYDDAILELLGIPETRALLPEIVPSSSVIGGLLEGALPGVPAGTPVIAGSLDVAAAAEGLGIRETGQSLCILGTTFCVMRMISDGGVLQSSEWPRIGSILYSLSPGRSLRLLGSLNGSAVFDWGRRVFGDLEISEAEEEAGCIAPGADGVLFLPFLFGERAPFRDASASGSFLGLRAHHGRGHMLRAVYEGLAMVVRLCIDESSGLSPEKVVVTGGASGSSLFCRILADLLNKEVLRRDIREPGIEGVWSLLTGRHREREGTCPACPETLQRGEMFLRGETRFVPEDSSLYETLFMRFRNRVEQRELMR